ncbi:MAG TPA: undecaprenyldiphospho-muramoylpentapeptide beta-N-acetylglucosaminyltransferase [Negativicutes bacterium]
MPTEKSNIQNSIKTIVFTGGGSIGHVTLNLSLIPKFLSEGWKVVYIGSNGMEKELIENIPNVEYKEIPAGKFRRYLDAKNISDIGRVAIACAKASLIISKLKPSIIFSKGGYVSFPVVFGGWINKVPTIIHESDLSPGLANKMSLKFVSTVCTTFPETKNNIEPNVEIVELGPIIRTDLKHGNKSNGTKICSFKDDKPIILIVGGSLGAEEINCAVRNSLNKLLNNYNIIHVCGNGNTNKDLNMDGYCQFEYVKDEFPDLLAASDVVISRAGSNTIYELLFMKKPMLLIPLPASRSRGDQIENARSFEGKGFAKVLINEECKEKIVEEINYVYSNRNEYINAMKKYNLSDKSLDKLHDIIVERAL